MYGGVQLAGSVARGPRPRRCLLDPGFGGGIAGPGRGIEAAATPAGTTELEDQLASLATGTLTPEEVAGLVWMREEEKLAHDVYVTLYEQWQIQAFSNIARSEVTHMDAVKTLLDRYGLADPAAANPVGVFTNPEIQTLYDELVARGRTSEIEALRVGATIEDLDIVDLQQRASTTPDIALVYDTLERARAITSVSIEVRAVRPRAHPDRRS